MKTSSTKNSPNLPAFLKLSGLNALNFPENLYIKTINNDDRDYDNIDIILYAQVGSTSIKSDQTSFKLFVFSD